jgi:hypothetical protein
MEYILDFIDCNTIPINDKLNYINTLPIQTVIDLLNSYEIKYVETKTIMYIIIRTLQDETLGIQSLENRYYSRNIDEDIILFSHIDEIDTYSRNIVDFIKFLKRKEKYAWRLVPRFLENTCLSKDIIRTIGEKYLGLSFKDIFYMINKLSIVLRILDNIKRCHIEYYYMINIWEEFINQSNQQGLIEAEEHKDLFMKNYYPNTNIKKIDSTHNYPIHGDFLDMYKQWSKTLIDI